MGWGLSVMPSDRRVAHSIITRRPSVPTAPPNAHTHIHPSHYYPSHIHPASRRVSSYPPSLSSLSSYVPPLRLSSLCGRMVDGTRRGSTIVSIRSTQRRPDASESTCTNTCAHSHDPPPHLIVYVLTHTRSLHPRSSCRYEQFLQKRNPGAQNITYDVGDFNKWLDKQEVGMIA